MCSASRSIFLAACWETKPLDTVGDGCSFVFPVLRPSRVDLPRDPEVIELQRRLSELKLSNKEIADREDKRIAATQAFLKEETRKGLRQAEFILRTQTPWFVMLPYKILCWLLGETFTGSPGSVPRCFTRRPIGGKGGGVSTAPQMRFPRDRCYW